jgi:N4-gp56 family major capsid protein
MALGSNHSTTTTQAVFIPEVWSDDVIASYKKNLVLSNLVTKLNHSGKKGDTIHIPAPTRSKASVKAAGTQVTLVANTESEIALNINKHYEYSKVIEDIVEKQALSSMRGFYTDDAGNALAEQVDQDLHLLGAGLQGSTAYSTAVIGGDGATAFDATANTNTGNASTLTDAGIRKIVQTLDDANVPQSERVLVIPPVERNTMMGIARFTEQAFTGEMGGGNTIRTGQIGEVYGIPVYVSTHCPWIHVNSVTGTFSVTNGSAAPTGTSYVDLLGVTINWDGSSPSDTTYRSCMVLHKSAIVHIEQMGVRTQSQYKQEFLGDLFTADTIYGIGELRNDAGVAFMVPS